MNKKELILELSNITETKQKDTELILNSFVDIIVEQLKKGEQVSIAGFGIFKKVDKVARVGINPSTREKINIPAKSIPKFVPAKILKDSF